MKHKYVLCIALIFFYLIGSRIYDNYQINSRSQFNNTNVKEIRLYQSSPGRSYNITIDPNTLGDIRKELVNGERKRVSGFSISLQPYEVLISLRIISKNGELLIVQGEDDQVFVELNKIRGNTVMLKYKSKYISGLIKDLYDEYVKQ